MNLETEVYEAYRTHILEHPELNRRGALAVRDLLEHSPVSRRKELEGTVQIPKVFSVRAVSDFERIVRTTYTILSKIIREYRTKEDYRKLFMFPRELEELILLPMQYEGFLPMARFDIFYNEETGDFRFCEINTDGSSGMAKELELRRALICNPAHQAVIRQYRLKSFELFDSWIRTFLKLYRTWPKSREHPNVAIMDFMEFATRSDFEEFARRFQEAGLNCEICDIRTVSYRDGVLYSEAGNRIDAIYRRAVTSDVLAHYDEITDFLNAVRDDAVFLAGAFSTQVVHTKWLFHILFLDRTMQILSEEERSFVRAHFPLTSQFSPECMCLEETIREKDRWILKPMDSYGSKGVYAAGREYGSEEWENLCRELYGQEYICQEYCRQYLTYNIDYAWGDGKWHAYANLPGLFSYDGNFAGVLMRMTEDGKIIANTTYELTVPVFVAREPAHVAE